MRKWYTQASWIGLACQLAVTAVAQSPAGDNDYKLGPDSQFNPAVPHGKVSKHTFLAGTNSVFPGTARDYWVYIPAQYAATAPQAAPPPPATAPSRRTWRA